MELAIVAVIGVMVILDEEDRWGLIPAAIMMAVLWVCVKAG